MHFLKIHFEIDGSANARTNNGKTVKRESRLGVEEPEFIAQLKDAVILGLVNDNTEIALPGFPPTTLSNIRKAWEF